MRKRKTQAGREGWVLICAVVCPSLPYGASKTDIRYAAYKAWKVGPDFPKGRIDETAQERSGWETYHSLIERAQEIGLRLPPEHRGRRNTTEPCADDREYITRLQAAADRLRNQKTLFGEMAAESIEEQIAQVEGRRFATPLDRR